MSLLPAIAFAQADSLIPPIITSGPITAGTVGELYTYDVEATGEPLPRFRLDLAPDGMDIDRGTGVITWTPENTGSYEVRVRAFNGDAPDATQSFTIEVSGIAPIITSTPITTASLGSPYSYDVEATGNPAPSYSLDSSPQGMSIEAMTGVISWTSSAPGSYPVTVRATNGEQPDGDAVLHDQRQWNGSDHHVDARHRGLPGIAIQL